MRYKSENKTKIDKPSLFFLIILLFIFSLGLIIIGLYNFKSKKVTNMNIVQKQNDASEEESLSDYFNKEFKEKTDQERDTEYLENDPFREICAETSGDGLPSITSNTVCFR